MVNRWLGGFLFQRPLDGIHDIILYAGVNPSIRFTPPQAGGGYIQNMDYTGGHPSHQ